MYLGLNLDGVMESVLNSGGCVSGTRANVTLPVASQIETASAALMPVNAKLHAYGHVAVRCRRAKENK